MATASLNDKTKPFFVEEKNLISACLRQERSAQKALYDRYAPDMLGVCKRYIRQPLDAEDVLIEAFFKVFSNLEAFKGEGSFAGWIRRIVVNEALMFLRRRHALQDAVDIEGQFLLSTPASIHDELNARDLLALLDQLPPGCRTVFNLYVIEGFKHREIADMLGISINTSKSQLILAKQRLREMLGDEYDMETINED